MRSKILEAINKAEGNNTATGNERRSIHSNVRSSKSKTPEPKSRTPDRYMYIYIKFEAYTGIIICFESFCIEVFVSEK